MIVVGAIAGWWFDKRAERGARPAATKQLGVLLASGLIVGREPGRRGAGGPSSCSPASARRWPWWATVSPRPPCGSAAWPSCWSASGCTAGSCGWPAAAAADSVQRDFSPHHAGPLGRGRQRQPGALGRAHDPLADRPVRRHPRGRAGRPAACSSAHGPSSCGPSMRSLPPSRLTSALPAGRWISNITPRTILRSSARLVT